jgi:hypothetical protein
MRRGKWVHISANSTASLAGLAICAMLGMLAVHCVFWVNMTTALPLGAMFRLWMLVVMLFVLHVVMLNFVMSLVTNMTAVLALGAPAVLALFCFVFRWRISTSVHVLDGLVGVLFAVRTVL